MILIQQLHKSFGKNHVLKGVDIAFSQPGIVAVLGPNGSGKTTLIMVLPDSGSIKLQGEDIKGRWLYRNQIAYLPQIARFPENLTVAELLRMVKDLNTGIAHDTELIAHFGIQDFLDSRLGNLSGGTRQKVNLVLTFMYDCPIIILDEPTAGLDPVSIVRLKELINQQRSLGKTIIITTHVMSLVEELAEEVLFLLEGQLRFRGSLRQLKEQSGVENVERAIASLLTTNLQASC
jgi:Cu-processing system ATP-binding protein